MSILLEETQTCSVIDSVKNIAGRYDNFILDIWGVLHDGIQPFAGTVECMEQLKKAGKQICLLSNTPKRCDMVSGYLENMGIGKHLYDHVLTAGESACLSLRDRRDKPHQKLGKKCYLIDDGLTDATDRIGLILDGLDLELHSNPEHAEFIMNSCGAVPHENTEAVNRKVDNCAKYNLPMICLNPDIIVDVGNQEYACGGMFARRYEELGGTVIYHGKPHKPVYDMAWRLLGKPDKSRIIAIGDSLHTDIQGANNFGIDCLFNLSGIHSKEVKSNNKLNHDMLNRLIASQPYRPTAILNEFKW